MIEIYLSWRMALGI